MVRPTLEIAEVSLFALFNVGSKNRSRWEKSLSKYHYLLKNDFNDILYGLRVLKFIYRINFPSLSLFFPPRLKCPYETAVELAALCLQGTFFFGGN